nr:SOS response-associated peptidase family protein [Pantoea stewartii]
MLINSRGETVASGKMFRPLWQHGRAVVPANGWFEGALTDEGKQPYFIFHWALLNKWILCCGTMKTVVSDNIKSMRYMLAYDGVLSGISVFYQNSADKTE